MFLEISIFWALLRAHFNPRLTARAKMSLSRTQNMFMPANITSIVLFLYYSRLLSLFSAVSENANQTTGDSEGDFSLIERRR